LIRFSIQPLLLNQLLLATCILQFAILVLHTVKTFGTIISIYWFLGVSTCSVLSNNFFGGVIPKEIAGLDTLEILDLSNNNLTGEVPQEIAEMPSLKHL
jgi:hypothetical protein